MINATPNNMNELNNMDTNTNMNNNFSSNSNDSMNNGMANDSMGYQPKTKTNFGMIFGVIALFVVLFGGAAGLYVTQYETLDNRQQASSAKCEEINLKVCDQTEGCKLDGETCVYNTDIVADKGDGSSDGQTLPPVENPDTGTISTDPSSDTSDTSTNPPTEDQPTEKTGDIKIPTDLPSLFAIRCSSQATSPSQDNLNINWSCWGGSDFQIGRPDGPFNNKPWKVAAWHCPRPNTSDPRNPKTCNFTDPGAVRVYIEDVNSMNYANGKRDGEGGDGSVCDINDPNQDHCIYYNVKNSAFSSTAYDNCGIIQADVFAKASGGSPWDFNDGNKYQAVGAFLYDMGNYDNCEPPQEELSCNSACTDDAQCSAVNAAWGCYDVSMWNSASAWSAPIAINTLPGTSAGNIVASTSYAVGNTLMQGYWTTDVAFPSGNTFVKGYYRSVPIVDGNVDWNNAGAWQGAVNQNTLPGSGTLQAQAGYVVGNNVKSRVVRGGKVYELNTSTGAQALNTTENASWTEVSVNFPVSATALSTYSVYTLDNVAYEAAWFGSQGYLRTAPVSGNSVNWGSASNWEGPFEMATAGLPGSGDLMTQDDFVVGGQLIQAIWRGNQAQGFLRTVQNEARCRATEAPNSTSCVQSPPPPEETPLMCNDVCTNDNQCILGNPNTRCTDISNWSEATDWSQPIASSSLPGNASDKIVAQASYQLGSNVIQGFWRANASGTPTSGWFRTVPVVNGTPQWPAANAGWTTVALTELPGNGVLQAQAGYVAGTNLISRVIRDNTVYEKVIPIVNGSPVYANTQWVNKGNTSYIPGAGAVDSYSVYILDGYAYEAAWKGGKGYMRTAPVSNDNVNWSVAMNWEGPFASTTLPGSGTMLTQDDFVVGDKLIQGLWRGDASFFGYSRTVQTASRCRHVDNVNSSSCTPTNPPIDEELMCRNISLLDRAGKVIDPTKSDLFSIGMEIRMQCGASDPTDPSISRYEFKIKEPSGTIVEGSVLNPAGNASISLPYAIKSSGRHEAQCRLCTKDGAGRETCQAYQTL